MIPNILHKLRTSFYFFRSNYWKPLNFHYGKIGKKSYINLPASIDGAQNIFLGDNVRIKPHSTILTVGEGKLIMKNNIDCAVGLTVVASNHRQKPGVVRDGSNSDNSYRNVIVEDDVWIGANVTLLSGANIGRGAIIGAGSVVRGQTIPPYAIVIGNPAKIIGFKFTPDEIIFHEKSIYPVNERIDAEVLKSNYQKFYIDRKDDILKYRSLYQ